MYYSAPAGSRWKLAPGSLTSGGDHLSTKRLTSGGDHLGTEWLASGGDHLCTGQPHQRWRPPLQRRLASNDSHLSACPMAKRPSLLPSYGGEDKTIQAMEMGAQRQAVLVVWPGPRSRSLPPTFIRLVIILFLQMLEEEADHQPMWEAEPWLSSLSTTARLMNILEAKHRWKSAAPTRPRTSSRGKTRPVAPAH
jgi:hypothetical protein